MKTIKETLDHIPEQQRDLLMYAFEHGLSQVIFIPKSKEFIGVNVENYTNIEIVNQIGRWAIGKVK